MRTRTHSILCHTCNRRRRNERTGPVPQRIRVIYTIVRADPVTIHYGGSRERLSIHRKRLYGTLSSATNLYHPRTALAQYTHACYTFFSFPPRVGTYRHYIIIRRFASRFGRRHVYYILSYGIGIALCVLRFSFPSLSPPLSFRSEFFPIKRRPPAAPGVARKPRTCHIYHVIILCKSAVWVSNPPPPGRFVTELLDLRPAGRSYFHFYILFHVPCAYAHIVLSCARPDPEESIVCFATLTCTDKIVSKTQAIYIRLVYS